MTPYYQDEWVTIYHADYRDTPWLNHGPIDCVVTDPPYTSGDIGKRHIKAGFEMVDVAWFNLALTLTANIAVSPGIANLWSYPPARWVLCWYKPGAPSFNKLGGYNAWEPILIYGKPAGRFGQDTIEQVPLNFKRGPEKHHPCPKPMKVWSWLIEGMSGPGSTIVDFFAGSGTTGICAKKLGRKAILSEIKEEYCEIAANRCSQSVMRFAP